MSSTYETKHFINGEFVPSKSGKTFPLINPFNEEVICQVSEGQVEDVDAAVDAAVNAQKSWAKVPMMEKARLLNLWADVMGQHAEEIAECHSVAMGVPMTSCINMVKSSLEGIRMVAGLCLTGQYGTTSQNRPNAFSYTIRQPFGVVAVIAAWNGPSMILAGKVAPALAAGNTVVLKSSEKAPLTSLQVAHYMKDIFPPGVINMVSGYGQVAGQALASHMKVRKITFTGSGPTGKAILKASAESNLKNVSLELGGKSACLVFEDADISRAAKSASANIFANAGQICAAHSRIYVQNSVADRFIKEYVDNIRSYSVPGDPLDRKTRQGPQADRLQYDRIMGFIDEAKGSATVATGGKRIGSKGYFIEPTVFTDVKPDSRINREEVFGPVSVIHRFETEEEALALANNTEYGLSSGVFTQSLDRAIRVAAALEAGGVAVNGNETSYWDMPFGGYKQSGIGREKGKNALEFFMEEKAVFINLPTS